VTLLSGGQAAGYNTAMWRIMLRWLTPLVVATVCLAPAYPQTQPTDKKTNVELRRLEEQPAPPAPVTQSSGSGLPFFEYFLIVAATLLIMVIVCTPSRKSSG
jgi:hypothetical protein